MCMYEYTESHQYNNYYTVTKVVQLLKQPYTYIIGSPIIKATLHLCNR